MLSYFRDRSSQVPFKRCQIYKDFGFRFCLHFTGGLSPCFGQPAITGSEDTCLRWPLHF